MVPLVPLDPVLKQFLTPGSKLGYQKLEKRPTELLRQMQGRMLLETVDTFTDSRNCVQASNYLEVSK